MKRPKIYFMKKLFTLFVTIWAIQVGLAQTYNNEWIDFSKTYYKFKVGKAGLFRISQTTLSAIGLAAIPAQQFKLY